MKARKIKDRIYWMGSNVEKTLQREKHSLLTFLLVQRVG